MSPDQARDRKALYAAVWRWHFYAGLYVVPFLVMLALTGLVMLMRGPVERWQLGDLLDNTPGAVAPHQARLDAARAALPDATFVRYRPLDTVGQSTRVSVTRGDELFTVFVDAGTGLVRGVVEDASQIYSIADTMHGTLLVGDTGDRLIEIAACLGILLLVSGLYLWFPGLAHIWQGLTVSRGPRRVVWRDLHRVTGVVLAPVLLFYLISGLSWTGVWGERFVQAWNTFPAEKAAPGGASEHTHDALNGGGPKTVPWNLEQTPLPVSPSSHEHHEHPLTLDAALAIAHQEGIGPRYSVGVPVGMGGVWTIDQTTMTGDILDPRDELTLHLDQRTGAILGRIAWQDYGVGAKAMATSIPLHMGYFGWWNVLGAAAVCAAVMLLSVSGVVMWWLRRPAREWRLAAPPALQPARVPMVTWASLILLSLLFPLLGLILLGVAIVDRLVVRRLPTLQALLN